MKKSLSALLAAAMTMSLLTGCVTIEPAETTASETPSTEAQADASSAEETEKAADTAENEGQDTASYAIGIGQFADQRFLIKAALRWQDDPAARF